MYLVQQGQLWPLVYQWMLTLDKPVWWEKIILTSPEVQAAATSKTWFSRSLLFSFSVKKKTKTGSVHRAGSFVHEWLDAKGLHVQWDCRTVVDPGEGSSPPPLILRPNWGLKCWKKFFWRPPPPPLSQGLDDRAPALSWRSGSATACISQGCTQIFILCRK